ncbi:MAG: prepilin-type N-terminal cleavage/methylation domain-containing protein [Patescibacteria group bacterium]|nr:prepilin-type N-terminal cleavage/methylation domain-containing protein [Patescibacteria group bacterium]
MSGFTLIEMLVVLAIIVIITSLALSGQSAFNQTLLLTNAAYDLGITVRQAESYGISSRSFTAGGQATTNAGYGIDFSNADLHSYTLFADIARPIAPPTWCPTGVAGTPTAKPGDCLFEASSNETVDTYTFTRGFSFSKFCGRALNTGATLCSGSGLDTLDVVFVRPNTEAILTGRKGGAAWQLSNAIVYLTSPAGGVRCVTVTDVGQISVSNSCP